MRRMSVLPAALAMLATAAYGQNANEILAKVAANYSNLSSCHFEGTRVVDTVMAGARSSQTTGFIVAIAKPDKVRVEFDYGHAGVWVRTTDGTTFTRYRSATKELETNPASPDDLRITDGTFLDRYEAIDQDVAEAKITGSEAVPAAGASRDCYVVEVRYKSGSPLPNTERLPTRFWIDKASFLVWREVMGTKSSAGRYTTENTTTVTFTSAQVNGPVPPSLFAFKKHR